MSSPDLTALVELTEAELAFQLAAGAPAHVRSALGITTGRIGGGSTVSMSNDPTGGYWNRSIGLGVTEPVTERLVGEVVDFHRAHGSPMAQLLVAPEFLPPNWDDIRAAYGLTEGNHLVKLACHVDDFVPRTSELRVGLIAPGDVDEWVTVVAEAMSTTDNDMIEMFAACVTNSHFRPFAAWDGDEIVAVANLFLHGEGASFNTGITRESHRGRGAQSALLAARARLAAESGVRWLTAATERPDGGSAATSHNNLVRSGLAPLYERQAWIWRPDPVTTAEDPAVTAEDAAATG